MTHLMSGLMSWMKRGLAMSNSHRDQLKIWAQNEYKKDWQFAYNYMLTNNGRAPNYRELNGPAYVRREVA